ncbi:MAG: hypothetical protein ABR568_21850, partial [Pyrinomonadaceae bacterium]
ELRLLLTPQPVALWGAREVILSRHFIVLPATTAGLLSVADYFETGQRPNLESRSQDDNEEPPDIYDQSEVVRLMRRYLGEELFQWLCACAYVPELKWDLTLSLGSFPCMGRSLLTEENLLKLTHLQWFQDGSIPDDYRAVLINELDAEKKEAIHSSIIDLLNKNLPPRRSDPLDNRQIEMEIGKVPPRKGSLGGDSSPRVPGWVNMVLRRLKKALLSPIDLQIPASLYKRLKAYAVADDRVRVAPRVQADAGREKEADPASVKDIHPKRFYLLFAAETFERFGFYSMLALFTLYLQDPNDGFGWTAEQATTLYSWYLMFVYTSPLVGGIIADWKLGYRRAVMIGGLFFMVGHALLSFHRDGGRQAKVRLSPGLRRRSLRDGHRGRHHVAVPKERRGQAAQSVETHDGG